MTRGSPLLRDGKRKREPPVSIHMVGNWRKGVTMTTARRDCFRAGNRTSGNEAGDLMLTRVNTSLSVPNKWVRMRPGRIAHRFSIMFA